jgi:DNA end-binding protein Ku
MPQPTPRTSARGHPLWKGFITIGLVNVQVQLVTMVHDHSFSFHLLHKDDSQPLRYERVCTKDGKVVPWDETLKGYEVAKGEYVTLTKEEIAAAMPESDRRIRLDRFVFSLALDPVFFNTSYLLVPLGDPLPYHLMREALERTGKAGVGLITLRTRESPAVVRPYRESLVLTTLHYPDEVADPSSFDALAHPRASDPRQLDLAVSIIDQLTGDLDLSQYRDGVRDRLEEVILRKSAGKEVVQVSRKDEGPGPKEIMDALEATLARMEKG